MPLPTAPHALLGRWRLLRAHHSLDFAPEAGMEFRTNGELIYSFAVGDRRQDVAMAYRVEGDVLRTISSAGGHVNEVRFRIGVGDVLVFDFAGAEACFLREQGE